MLSSRWTLILLSTNQFRRRSPSIICCPKSGVESNTYCPLLVTNRGEWLTRYLQLVRPNETAPYSEMLYKMSRKCPGTHCKQVPEVKSHPQNYYDQCFEQVLDEVVRSCCAPKRTEGQMHKFVHFESSSDPGVQAVLSKIRVYCRKCTISRRVEHGAVE